MTKLTINQQKIINIILRAGSLQSSQIFAEIVKTGENISLVTVKRILSAMVRLNILLLQGSGRSTNYNVSSIGRVFADIDAKKYCTIEPDQRYGMQRYNFDLFAQLPTDIWESDELALLTNATAEHKKRIQNLSPTIQKKELERLIIELSWKSSKIEGNTYTLLDTEKLILENQEALGHDHKEARMILNHKNAFQYIHEYAKQFKVLTQKNLEELHAILVKGLSVELGLRKKSVGIIGSRYQPLDNVHQIREAVERLGGAISRMSDPYAKALIALLGISYIQPFEDGNKRTGRLMANALLLAHQCAPLSYRSIDENDYREALLTFYELNSIADFKKIFIAQYTFAAQNYTVK